MKLDQENIVHGGITGALFGIAYIFARSWWTNDYSDATALNLIGAALVGAVAGIAAFAVRWSTGTDGK